MKQIQLKTCKLSASDHQFRDGMPHQNSPSQRANIFNNINVHETLYNLWVSSARNQGCLRF